MVVNDLASMAVDETLPTEVVDLLAAFVEEVAPPFSSPDDIVANLKRMGLSDALDDAAAAQAAPAPHMHTPLVPPPGEKEEACLPIVQMHGMGDFADNPAYKRLGEAVSATLTGSADSCYLLTPQLGQGPLEDIVGSFLRPLDDSIDYFAEIVRNDTEVAAAGAFNAIGYSQGNLIIRGYIEKYNDPPVHHFMSMFGPHMGVAGFPGCDMTYQFCKSLDYVLGSLAYLPVVQNHLMQANYYRDPTHLEEFRSGDVGLAELNDEARDDSSVELPTGSLTLAGMSGNLTLVKGLADTTVQPNDSEWFGYYADGSQSEIMNLTDAYWYTWFGLDEMESKGQLAMETVPGKHMQFTTTELTDLIDEYWA